MSQELIVKKYSLEKGSRIAGVAIVTAITLASIACFVAAWWPIVFLLAPALLISNGILVSGIESNAKATYYRDIVGGRKAEVMRDYKLYPSLYENGKNNFMEKLPAFRSSLILKAVLTGQPVSFVLDTKKTDKFGGRIDSGIEINGFIMTIQEKNHPSDIQMWSEAYKNAALLK